MLEKNDLLVLLVQMDKKVMLVQRGQLDRLALLELKVR